jgi:hypothetical protein
MTLLHRIIIKKPDPKIRIRLLLVSRYLDMSNTPMDSTNNTSVTL